MAIILKAKIWQSVKIQASPPVSGSDSLTIATKSKFFITKVPGDSVQNERPFATDDGIVVVYHYIDNRFILPGTIHFTVFVLVLSHIHHLQIYVYSPEMSKAVVYLCGSATMAHVSSGWM